MSVDVAIIGAGLAGLQTARRLAERSISFHIFEARDRVGGRTESHFSPGGTALDVGAQWIGGSHSRMKEIASELGVETHATYCEGNTIFHWNGRQSTYKGLVPKTNPFALVDFGQAQLRLDRLAKTVDLDAPWKNTHLDQQTFASWIKKASFTQQGRHLLHLFTETVFAAEASDISLLHALYYTHSSGGSEWLAKASGGAQETRFVRGTQAVSIAMAETLDPTKVSLETPVRKVTQRQNSLTVYYDGGQIEAKAVVCAVPLALISRIVFEPGLSPTRRQLIQRAPMGSVIKGQAVYARPFWRDKGLNGQVASNVGPIKVMFEHSHQDGNEGVLTGFFEGEQANIWAEKTPEQRRSVFIDCAVRYFGEEARQVTHFTEKVWADDPWAEGCYTSLFAPGTWSRFGHVIRRPEGRVHFAGTETASRFAGYMEGAVRSADRVAGEVIDAYFT